MFDRSYHFIPANRPKLFDRAESLVADVYVFDLEDAVSRAEKPAALAALEEWLGQQQQFNQIFVRVNGREDRLAEAERAFLLKYPQVGIVLPKVTSAAMLRQSVEFYRLNACRRIIGLIEDAAGLQALPDILDQKVLQAVGLGLEDFLSDSIFDAEQLAELVDHIRTKIALAAMASGITAIDTISMDLTGGEQLKRDISNARSAGFNGKFSIHPSQIIAINEGFSPSEEVLKKASTIFGTLNSTNLESGYLRIAGEIISPPKLKKLQTIKQFSDHHELTSE
jgi:citrate lyase subunit beta/citryl-CoA lyase